MMVVAVAFPLAVAAVVLLRREEFPVQAFGELFLGSLPDGNDFPAEIQDFAGHRMVEVHQDAILFHLGDRGVDHGTVGTHHGQDPAHLHQVFADFTLDGKGTFGKVDELLVLVRPVTVLGLEREGECIALLESFQRGFEGRDKHMHALDIVQGRFFRGPVHKIPFHMEVVGYGHDFVLLDFHPLQSMFWNAKVGINLDKHKRASSATSVRLFHRSMKFPVTSISRTGWVMTPSSKAKPSIP